MECRAAKPICTILPLSQSRCLSIRRSAGKRIDTRTANIPVTQPSGVPRDKEVRPGLLGPFYAPLQGHAQAFRRAHAHPARLGRTELRPPSHPRTFGIPYGNPDTIVPALLALGDTACVSVPRANRLRPTSPPRLVVVCRAAAPACALNVKKPSPPPALPNHTPN